MIYAIIFYHSYGWVIGIGTYIGHTKGVVYTHGNFDAQVTALRDAFEAARGRVAEAGIQSLTYIGDCVAPGPIAQAVHEGHLFARDFASTNTVPLRVEPIGQTIP